MWINFLHHLMRKTPFMMGVMLYHTDVPVAWMWWGEGGALAFFF